MEAWLGLFRHLEFNSLIVALLLPFPPSRAKQPRAQLCLQGESKLPKRCRNAASARENWSLKMKAVVKPQGHRRVGASV